jgi:hypothetical protein
MATIATLLKTFLKAFTGITAHLLLFRSSTPRESQPSRPDVNALRAPSNRTSTSAKSFAVRSEPSKVLWPHENYLKKGKDLFRLSKRQSVSQSAFSLSPSTATPVFHRLNPVAATGPNRHPARTERESRLAPVFLPSSGKWQLPTLTFQIRIGRASSRPSRSAFT